VNPVTLEVEMALKDWEKRINIKDLDLSGIDPPTNTEGGRPTAPENEFKLRFDGNLTRSTPAL